MHDQPIKINDLDASTELQRRIAAMEALQSRMAAANAAIRRNTKSGEAAQVGALVALGYSDETARRLLRPDFAGRIGFPAYELTNNGANIRRLKERVKAVATLQAAEPVEIEGSIARFEDAPQDNRVRLFYPGKPDESVRTRLKGAGFRWTPSLGCWQAFRNSVSLWRARQFAGVPEVAEPVAEAAEGAAVAEAAEGVGA